MGGFEMEVEKSTKMKEVRDGEGGEELDIGGDEDLSPADRNKERMFCSASKKKSSDLYKLPQ